MARIVLVDDDANLRHTLGYALRQEGFEVFAAEDGERGLEAFHQSRPDVVLLDVMLPNLDGFEVCRRIRKESDVPILMLTARDTELDKVVGLELGADDYLAKPFSTRELVARVRALLRRTRQPVAAVGERLESAGLLLDAVRHRVTLEGREIALKPKEFDLLAFFMAHSGQVFGREQLLASVWGYDFAG
nr:response regulator transcription factor [Chloroflexota bacterium]